MSEKNKQINNTRWLEGVLVIHGICTYVDIQINDALRFMCGSICPGQNKDIVSSVLHNPRAVGTTRKGRTMIQVVLEAHTNLFLRVSSDGQPRFTINILLVQVHVLLRTRVDDLNVDALVEARCDVRGDNHERIHVCCIPYAF
jgi:hypothetical protein